MTRKHPKIQIKIKTYVENPDIIKFNYVKTLMKKIRKILQKEKIKIVEKLMEYEDKDVCELPSIFVKIPHKIQLTANGNIFAKTYHVPTGEFSTDTDLVLYMKYVEIYKNNNIIEAGKIYISIRGWNKVCGEWTVKELLEEDDYQPEISIIYRPRTVEDDDP